MNDLKPCPFCGGEGEIGHHSINIANSIHKNIITRFFSTCTNCMIEMQHFETENEAINTWNKRIKCGEC